MGLVDRYCRRLFFFVLVFAPLAFGTVEPWSYALMESAAVAALFLYLIYAAESKSQVVEVPGLRWLILFLVFILLQCVPLPGFLVELVSPAAYKLQQSAAFARGTDAWMTLSVHPRATIQAFFRYASYAAFYILAIQLLSQKDFLKKTVFVVTIFGAVLAFSSILQLYLTEDMALWVKHVPVNSMIVGPYICHNHYAGLMEMIFPVVLALFFFQRPRLDGGSLVKDIIEIFGQKKGNIHILIGAAALLIAVSIFLSLSRGGIISTCLAFFFFIFMISRRRISRGGSSLSAVIVLLVCLSISWFGWDMIFERFSALKNEQGVVENARFDYWKDSVAVIRDYPVAGAGFGTFADIYRPYQSIGDKHFVDHAHNDYLEIAAEGGGAGFLLFFGFIGAVLFKAFRGQAQRRDPYAIYIFTGSITGVIALLFHSFSDFNLQIGANGLWFFFLLALTVSAAHTRIQVAGNATFLKGRDFSGKIRGAGLYIAGTLLALTVAVNLCFVIGAFYYNHISDHSARAGMAGDALKKIQKIAGYAAMFDPLNAKYDFALANPAWFLSEHDRAEEALVRAIAKNPANAEYYKRYGLFLAQAGRKEKAAGMMRQSVVLDPVNPDNALEYGALLIGTGKEQEGVGFLKKAVELDQAAMGKVLATLAARGFTPLQAAEAVPDKPGAVIRYAGFLADLGRRDAASQKYFHALELMEQGHEFKRHDVYSVYRFFQRQGSTRQVMDVLQRAEKLLPEDGRIRIYLGDMYRQQGIFYKAAEKYEAALVIDPGNKLALRRLEQLSQ